MSRLPSGTIAIVRAYEEPPDSMASSGPNLDREQGKCFHFDLRNLNQYADVSLLLLRKVHADCKMKTLRSFYAR